ncbi:MAG: RNA 2',3'-cyclic phosphodiesterase [Planctomycetes bacterium B3_Pla]|nr:MAG: RNA 2',3'-cyclic phosphodiesterase [Planctomycetes bacterium B3_Pla]
MRCFIAIDIDDQIRKGLGKLQDELRSKVDVRKGDVKWVSPDATHLTLKFLGEIRDEQVVEVCNITGDVASRHKSFELDIGTLGCFGGRSAKVLWVGTGEDCENLLQLHRELEQQLDSAGWPRENRKLSAHLTLCRIRNAKAGIKLAQVTGKYEDLKLGIMAADSISVYQSELTPKGPIYTQLGNYSLQ